MKRTLIKYPPEAQETCEYEVIGETSWNSEANKERRETYRPAAGPYFNGEGWMLNAALAAYRGCNVVLVEERAQRRPGITIYRASRELVEAEAE